VQVITDPGTGRSKGYGFVRFGSEQERDRALMEMNGQYLSSRPIRVSLATAKKATTGTMMSATTPGATPSDMDPTNTTLFIGGLSASVSEDQLRSIFGRFGEIIYTKIPQGKGCGFVQFVDRKAAEASMAEMNGQVIGNSAVRISWGRSSTGKAPAAGGAATGAFSFNSTYPASYNSFDQQGYSAYPTSYASDPYSAYSTYGQVRFPVRILQAWRRDAQLCAGQPLAGVLAVRPARRGSSDVLLCCAGLRHRRIRHGRPDWGSGPGRRRRSLCPRSCWPVSV
jgi:RNA recognition motif-containing protein